MKQILFRADGDDTRSGNFISDFINAAGNAALKTGQAVGFAASGINTRTTNTNSASYSETNDGGRGVRIALIAGATLLAAVVAVLLIKRR